MKRRIVEIDEAKCNGCGACANACHEGAIAMVNGKAHLMRDDYCDGFGDCLPHCPTGAITFVEREAVPYNEAAVQAAKQHKAAHACPGSAPRTFGGCPGSMAKALHPDAETAAATPETAPSQLRQWPVQIKLVPTNAPYFDGARLLIAADCTAYAGGLPQAGRCGLQRKADPHHPRQRHQRSDRCADGSALLRRPGKRRQARPAGQRQVPALAGGDHLHRWPYSGLSLPLNRTKSLR